MERKFHSSLRTGSGHTFLKLQGVVDEDNTLADLGSQIQGETLVLDLADVERINSCGVRDWVNWLNKVSAAGVRTVMIRCSPAIIAQVNMVTNFVGDAVIHSFFAPYYNPETEETKNVLLYTADLASQTPPKAPAVKCSETGYPMEFDDFEESYFAFIATSGRAALELGGNILGLVRHFTPELGGPAPATLSGAVRPAAVSVSALPSVPPMGPPSIHDQLTPQPSPVVSVSRLSGVAPSSAAGAAAAFGAAPGTSTSGPVAASGAHFLSSPRDVASASSALTGEGHWPAAPEESRRSGVALIAGLGAGLLLVFALLLWIAFR